MTARLRLLPLLALATLARSSPAGADDAWIERLRKVEERTLGGSYSWIKEQVVLRQKEITQIALEKKAAFEALGFLEPVKIPPNWNPLTWQFKGTDTFLARLNATKDPKELCRLSQLAYGYAIWQQNVIQPSTGVFSREDYVIRDRDRWKNPTFMHDVRVSAWAMRFLETAAVERKIPKGCGPCYVRTNGRKDFCLDDIAVERYNYVFFSETDTGSLRRPLGYAVDMCNKANAAHWRDRAQRDYGKRPPLLDISANDWEHRREPAAEAGRRTTPGGALGGARQAQ